MDTKSSILYLIQHLAVLANRQSDQVLQEQLGIGMSQYRILQVLHANPSVQQKQIAILLGQTEASISRQVKLMQSKSMITVHINPENRREHITKLLPMGERMLEAATAALAHYHGPFFEGLSSREQHQLHKLLAKIHSQICLADTAEGAGHGTIDGV